MTTYVADTHALFWYLVDSPRLGKHASDAFDDAAGGNAIILIPAIVLAELYYVNEKQGRPFHFADTYASIEGSGQFELVGFDAANVLDFDADAAVTEMHDRIIVGVARRRNSVLLTTDRAIIEANVTQTLW